MKKGRFIVFEGIDGAGKTTQVERLKSELEKRGERVFVTAEPTTLPSGKELRRVLSGEIKKSACEIAAMFTIPWSKIGKRPAPGEKWLFNALCDFTDPQYGRVYSVWEHNFDQATWRNTLDRQGTLQF